MAFLADGFVGSECRCPASLSEANPLQVVVGPPVLLRGTAKPGVWSFSVSLN